MDIYASHISHSNEYLQMKCAYISLCLVNYHAITVILYMTVIAYCMYSKGCSNNLVDHRLAATVGEKNVGVLLKSQNTWPTKSAEKNPLKFASWIQLVNVPIITTCNVHISLKVYGNTCSFFKCFRSIAKKFGVRFPARDSAKCPPCVCCMTDFIGINIQKSGLLIIGIKCLKSFSFVIKNH